jgi:hypothetical protein
LPEKLFDFFLVEPVGIFSDALCERAAFEQFHGEVAESLLEGDFMQFDNVLDIEFGEFGQCDDFAGEKILGDFVVDLG